MYWPVVDTLIFKSRYYTPIRITSFIRNEKKANANPNSSVG
jgi:hypothetical protein